MQRELVSSNSEPTHDAVPNAVLTLPDINQSELIDLLTGYGLSLETVSEHTKIPGSFWGDEEAGLIEHKLYARSDTPVHSLLHEACHYICMTPDRRNDLHTNAGGDYDEENAVCYLQIILADRLNTMGQARMFSDMDAWGYSFRLGSSRAWFDHDAEDARTWLLSHNLIDATAAATGLLRQG